MTKKTVLINGDYYTLCKGLGPYYNGKTSIFDLYKKPSYYKIDIFNYRSNKLDCITALTGNSMCFSIYGKLYGKAVKITKSYNYIQA